MEQARVLLTSLYRNPHTLRVYLKHAQQLLDAMPVGTQRPPTTTEVWNTIRCIMEQLRTDMRSKHQCEDRLWRVAIVLFPHIHTIHRRTPWCQYGSDERGMQPFTDNEVANLQACAASMGLRYEYLFQLLFTTGVRIGAVPGIRWSDVMREHVDDLNHENECIGSGCDVREKGGVRRSLCFTPALRDVLRPRFG